MLRKRGVWGRGRGKGRCGGEDEGGGEEEVMAMRLRGLFLAFERIVNKTNLHDVVVIIKSLHLTSIYRHDKLTTEPDFMIVR